MSKKYDFLQIKNQTANQADLYFYGDIVSSDWERWMAEEKSPNLVRNILAGMKGKDLNVYINSNGGSVFGGMAIYNQLKRHDGKVTCYIDGIAASIASIIAFAGDELIIPNNGTVMIHNPTIWAWGESEDMRRYADLLDTIKEEIIGVYLENAKEGITREYIAEMMDRESWFDGKAFEEIFECSLEPAKMAVAASGSNYLDRYRNTPKNLVKQKNERPNIQPIKAKKEEDAEMKTIQEIKDKAPELYAEIYNLGKKEGEAAERGRLEAIDKIADQLDGDIVDKAKYSEPMDAKDLALSALAGGGLKKQEAVAPPPKTGAEAYLEAVEKDAKAANGVEGAVAPNGDDPEAAKVAAAAEFARKYFAKKEGK